MGIVRTPLSNDSNGIKCFRFPIMLVNNDDAERPFLTGMLNKIGINIIETVSARKNLEIVREERPDFIFLDISLPDICGFKVYERLKINPCT